MQFFRHIKAAYIFSLMPGGVRSMIMTLLGSDETARLEKAMIKVGSLTGAQRIRILKEFIHSMRTMRRVRAGMVESGVTLSMVLAALLLVVSLLWGIARFGRIGAALGFAESILLHGGLHVILMPFILGYIRSRLTGSFLRYVTAPSGNIIVDVSSAVAVGGIIALLLATTSGSGSLGSLDPVVKIFYIVVSVSLGPFLEEAFFRLYLFLLPGSRYGYAPMGLLSSLAFALVHVPDSLSLFAGYFGCGALLALLAYMRKTILAPFLAHGFANLLLLVF